VWFLINDGKLVFNTMRDSAKGRARARDPRVAVYVDDRHPPFSFVQMQGVATTTEDRPGPSWLGWPVSDCASRRSHAAATVLVWPLAVVCEPYPDCVMASIASTSKPPIPNRWWTSQAITSYSRYPRAMKGSWLHSSSTSA